MMKTAKNILKVGLALAVMGMYNIGYFAKPAKADDTSEKPKTESRLEDQFSDSLDDDGVINSSNLSWLQLKYPNLVFGFRDTSSYEDKKHSSSQTDAGIEVNLDKLLSFALMTNLNLADDPDFKRAQKARAALRYDPVTIGVMYGEKDLERMVVSYGILKIMEHTFAISYSDYEKDASGKNEGMDLQRLNWMFALDFKRFALGAGTSGIDNESDYVATARIRDVLGMGIQTHAFFNEQEGITKYVFFTTRDEYQTERLAVFHMPLFTNIYGTNSIINEQNLLTTDLPRIDEVMSDPNDYGFSVVFQPEKSITAEIGYRGPKFHGFSPMIVMGYTGKFEGGEDPEDIVNGRISVITPAKIMGSNVPVVKLDFEAGKDPDTDARLAYKAMMVLRHEF